MSSLPPEKIKEAARHAETPAGISTVEFKELGDSKRSEKIDKIIRATWSDECHPASLQLKGYSGNGSSEWAVHCKITALREDYLVTLPERASDNARVLKCYASNPRWTICNLFGGPPA